MTLKIDYPLESPNGLSYLPHVETAEDTYVSAPSIQEEDLDALEAMPADVAETDSVDGSDLPEVDVYEYLEDYIREIIRKIPTCTDKIKNSNDPLATDTPKNLLNSLEMLKKDQAVASLLSDPSIKDLYLKAKALVLLKQISMNSHFASPQRNLEFRTTERVLKDLRKIPMRAVFTSPMTVLSTFKARKEIVSDAREKAQELGKSLFAQYSSFEDRFPYLLRLLKKIASFQGFGKSIGLFLPIRSERYDDLSELKRLHRMRSVQQKFYDAVIGSDAQRALDLFTSRHVYRHRDDVEL